MNLLPETEDPERLQLITELKKKVPLSAFGREFWGLIWLSDIESLREFVRLESSLLIYICGTHGTSNSCVSATWSARTRTAPSTPKRAHPEPEEESPSGTKKRKLSTDAAAAIPSSPTTSNSSESARKQCLERDRKRCVITDVGDPVEVAHIYPYSLNSRAVTDSQVTFWGILSNFWTSEQIDSWKNAVLGPHGTETCSNLICLSPSIHKYWGRAYFALKPIEVSGDKKTMKVQFCWLPINQDRSSQPLNTRPNLQTTRPDTPGNDIKMLNSTDEDKVQTGREIVLKTDDPVARPLPSWELLTMQWSLQRLAALTGAAEPEDLSDNDDDDPSEVVSSDCTIDYDESDDGR